MTSTIVLGIDGSDHSKRATQWCAAHAAALGAEVLAVHVVEMPTYLGARAPYVWIDVGSHEQRETLLDTVEREWCKPLADAGVHYRAELVDGQPASALMQAARDAGAALVVCGRRGLSGFKELVLGSTTHHLSHHLDRPLVVVP